MNRQHIILIHDLMRAADAIGLPLWLESGWAVDARLGAVTREHADVDLAIPAERLQDFHRLLWDRHAGASEETEYGFLVHVNGVLLDCEPCHLIDGRYEIEDTPAGSCPIAKEGILDGVPVRCTSWEAIVWEYFYYLQDLPLHQWPEKDRHSYGGVRSAMGESETDALHARFLARQRQVDGA